MNKQNRGLAVLFISFTGILISISRMAKAEEKAQADKFDTADKIEYTSEGLRDPFQEELIEIEEEPEVPAEPVPLPPLVVQGIVWGSSSPQAIINNKVLRIGDTIDGVRIIDINKGGVIVILGNQQHNLKTSPPISPEGPKGSDKGGKK